MPSVLGGHAVEGELVTDWVRLDEVALELGRQAIALAQQLGHDLQPWRPVHASERAVYAARCNACGDEALFAVRRFNRSPLSGTALTFRCRPKPAYVHGARLGIA